MAYISHKQLAERPGARELAQVAVPAHENKISYELMQASLTGADRSAWIADDVRIADAALRRIDDAVADATAVIDGFVGKRGYLPFTNVPPIVVGWCRAITRFYLHQDIVDDKSKIIADYKEAMKMLQQVANGDFSLGVADTVVKTSTGSPVIKLGSTTFRDALKDY